MRKVEMAIFKCRKCIPTNVPDEWTLNEKNIIAALVRKSEPISAMHKMRDLKNLPLIEAKNIALHITLKKGCCHHCRTELSEFEGNCPKCERLNLDW
jgi:hypothetical protein